MTCRMRRTILEPGELRREVLFSLRRLGFVDHTLISLGRHRARGKSRYLAYPGTGKALRVSDHPMPISRHQLYSDVAHSLVVLDAGTMMEADRIAWNAAQHFHREVERRYR